MLTDHATAHAAGVAGLRASRCVDYPTAVHIETLALCNAACSFCQYPALERKGDKLPGEWIINILIQLAEWLPSDHAFSLIFSGVSEPLLDKRLPDVIAEANELLPKASVHINTNGSALNEPRLWALLKHKIGALSVSLNHWDCIEWQRIMGLSPENYIHTMSAIRMLEEHRARGEIRFPLGLTRAGDGTATDAEFLAWCEANYPAWGRYVSPPFAWLDDEPVSRDVPDIGCTHWYDLTIRADGRVSWCCLDGHVKHARGDIRTQRLREIYNDPDWRALRASTLTRRAVPQCGSCTHC